MVKTRVINQHFLYFFSSSEGQKFTRAREWKLPVVNIQFLNELLLGNQSCMQMIHSPKYQHFTLEQPFRFDINIAPHLMGKLSILVMNYVFFFCVRMIKIYSDYYF